MVACDSRIASSPYRNSGGCMLHGARVSTFVRGVFLPLAICVSCSMSRAQEAPPYRDPQLSIDQRVAHLLSRMTLEEKLAQMEGAWENPAFFGQQQLFFVDQLGAFIPENAAVVLKNGLGEISRPSEGRRPRVRGVFTNPVQQWRNANTRVGMPVGVHDDCLHCRVARGG